MKIIDAHAHLMDEPGYLDGLLTAMDAAGIEKVCVSGLGPLFGMQDNTAVEAARRQHPDRIIGAVYVRPGMDGAETVDWGAEHGFRMLKVTAPTGPYSDPSFDPIWERALEHGMPVLFHTGLVMPSAEGRGCRVSSLNMQPMQVEPITREFPELKVILAHLGVNHNMDAAEMARIRANVYVDISGEPGGWRERMKATGLDHWLWWPGASEKLLFGTDVHYTRIKQILDEDRAIYDALGLDEPTRANVLGGTMRGLLGEPL
ncbi:MAG: amidohydrolase family protein [Lentisphaerae bacterium]|nr:amidohydrolase family protein [Lentisphaerota bacterium]